MHVGSCAYSFRDYLTKGKMTLEGFLDKAVEMGLDGVELTAYYFPDTEPETLYSIKRMALKRGLDISGTAVGNNFCQADPAKRAEQVAMVKKWLEHSVMLGAPLMRVFAGGVPQGYTESDARSWTIAALEECVETAKEYGVMLALENHGGITATAEQVEALIAGVSSDWLAVNLDTGNFRQDPYGSIRRIAPLAVTSHAKTEIPAPNGKTVADFARIVADLNAVGYRGYLSIEYEAAEDPMTAVPRFAAELLRLVRA
jgi:sugar phosphate isomerase/epimerase